jgi:hypothetical protein
MSVTFKFEVVKDTATPELQRVSAGISPHRLAAEIGPRLTRLAKKGTALATGKVAIYWLLAGCKQKPDPTVMPSDDAILNSIDQSVEVVLRRPTVTGGTP